MIKKILIVLIILTTSCGYQPIYLNKNIKNFEFNKIITEGDNNINKQIINSIGLKESIYDEKLNTLQIKSNYTIEETSKNSKGQVDTYRSRISIDIIIKKNKEIVKNKNFVETFLYNKKENKFELSNYQSDIKDNLINKILEEIILFLNM
tara:strand:+ start:1313 stop:1762 length:450 start_codon:yes stop_codon:yes gene_type:complete